MADLCESVPRVVRQLMIRRDTAWSGEDARCVVTAALMALGRPPMSGPQFRRLMAGVHRVGRTLGSAGNVQHDVPWNIDAIRDEIRLVPGLRTDCEHAETLIESLASKVKGFDFTVPQSPDWVSTINRSLLQVGTEEPLPDLRSKFFAAEIIQKLLEGRLLALVNHVSLELDTTEVDVHNALMTALNEYTISGTVKRSHRAAAQSRLESVQVEALQVMAHPARREAFEEWLKGLNPIAQCAVYRRLTQLSIEPLTRRLWVKTIFGARQGTLSELKVISGAVHYRIIIRESPSEPPTVLAFGLRRDLADLIVLADRVSALDTRP